MILKNLLKFINNRKLSHMFVLAENKDIELTEVKLEVCLDDLIFTYNLKIYIREHA